MAYKVKTAEARQRGNKSQVLQVLLDGKYMTYAAIGAVLGVAKDEAYRRYRSARKRGIWPIERGHLT
jgi:hypothetical protein